MWRRIRCCTTLAQIINDKLVEGPICLISRNIKQKEARYGASQMECLSLAWTLERLHHYLDGTVFDLWNRFISHTVLFQNIISDRDTKFTSSLLKSLHECFGTQLSFSTAYQPQTDGLEQRIIHTLEEIIRIFCTYGLEFKDSDGFNHDCCTLIPALELAYST
ncbi:hypothetical protein O181_031802 [Austropuccinia psidii MF-1]|uniref:Reverse transcriptase RNase H-like domain-containing protein n=1 Tax=Austropuccinia psidii MF-1 TaxID=1389203 RepID=A0A9Q3H5P9_9BASI|nr:hypothetical protein [Austropuccinia psidii MF-1]